MEPHENTRTFMLPLFLSLLSAETIHSQTHIIGICDDKKDLGFNSSAVFQSVFLASQETPRIRLEGTMIQGTRSLMENLNALDHGVQLYGSYFLVSFGSDAVVQASAITAHSFGIPAITYPTSPTTRLIYQENIIDLRPNLAGLANEVYTLIGQRILHKVHVICQDSLINDGFVEIFSRISQEDGFNGSHVMTISTIKNHTKLLRRALLEVMNSGNRIFVLHCTGEIFVSVMRTAYTIGLLDAGYAWIVTQTALTVDLDTLDYIPPAMIAVTTYEKDRYTDILKSTVDIIQQTLELIILDKTGKEAEDAIQSFLRAGNFSMMKKNNSLFDEVGNRRNVTYQLLKLVTSGSSRLTWNPIDYMRADALDIDTIMWPGQHIFGPIRRERGHVIVVTKESEPFVFITGPVESRYFCPGEIACIELYTDDPKIISFIVGRFKDGNDKMEGYYRTFCCEGVVMEMLQRISKELNFDFVVFFKNDSSYGDLVNGTWTGMVGNVVSGAADIIAGALSMSSSKMNAISFTHSFYHSGFNMISLTSGTHISTIAFLCPFNTLEWLCIFATASITAVATAILEWNSPFGLNPWGRGRRTGSNYSLGSGIAMVYSIWFRHSMKIKYPKSWPSKIVQNCWAWMAIFLIASYTANLAAVMAGNSDQEEIYSILDSRLHEKRIAVLPNSAAEVFTKTVNSGLGVKLQRHYVHSVQEAFRKLRDGEIDLFLDDHTLLEYHMHDEDTGCSLTYAGRLFGDESYAFGVRKGSWLKDKISALVLKYVKSGMIDELKWRYLRNRRRCVNNLQSSIVWKKFGLEHTVGLFVMLLIAMGIALILLCFEHLVYITLVPKVRIKPRNSFWKSKRFAFFSQRLYRSIVSEELVSARETAIEMIDMVKRRHFIRLFQKNELLEKRNEMNLIKRKKQGIGDITGNLVALKRLPTKPQEISDTTSIGPFTISSGYVTSERSFPVEHDRSWELTNFIDTNFSSSEANKPLDKLLNSKYHHNLGHINPAVSEEDDIDNYSIGYHRYVTMKNIRSSNMETDSTDSDAIRYTEETRRKSRAGWVFDKWPIQIPDGSIMLTPLPRTLRSFSLVDQFSNTNHMVNTGYVPMTSGSDRITHTNDYFSRNIELKDNRVKSTIRRHTMTGFHLSSSDALDKCAVEALSKADILVLWKQSEIELQTRLNQIEAQNRYMRHIIKLRELSNRDKENCTEQNEAARKF